LQYELESVEKWEYRLDNYVPMMMREVVEVYGSILHESCMIAIIEGYDKGEYYDIEEGEI
jgi:hypothetical protein